jgi:hypothetical protein
VPLPVPSIEYLHVELDSHDVLLAEGLPAESYLDTGNRGTFINGGPVTALHPDFALRIWDRKGCAELVRHGAKLVAARQRLLARAEPLGHVITTDAALAVFADGRQLALQAERGAWRVRLDRPAARVTLCSRAWLPAETDPESFDTRRLGVAVSRLTLDGRRVPLESPLLTAGWHAPEGAWRWTDGVGTIGAAGARELSFTIALSGRYWATSPVNAPARERLQARVGDVVQPRPIPRGGPPARPRSRRDR